MALPIHSPSGQALIRLGDLHDFEVADGDPDVRGWEVVGRDSRKIGSVSELIVDPQQMLVRYLDIVLDSGLHPENEKPRHVLLPIGFANLAQFNNQVFVEQLAGEQLIGCMPYDGGPVTREYEQALRECLPLGPEAPSNDYYAGHYFDSSGLFGTRSRPTPTPPEDKPSA